MAIDLPKDSAKEAVLSLQRYFKENMDNEIGNLVAEGLLKFFVEEIGPIIYTTRRSRMCNKGYKPA
ncbi:uncharacterized protein DUF2164 [Methylosinus sp. sav-2]|nr:uncharacterized protein DUF2164 [Methylosinus sp. sav-2]